MKQSDRWKGELPKDIESNSLDLNTEMEYIDSFMKTGYHIPYKDKLRILKELYNIKDEQND